MPIAVIAILVIAVLGVGAYVLTSGPEPMMEEPETTEIARTDSINQSDETVQDAEISGSGDDDSPSSSVTETETDEIIYTSEQSYLTPARTEHEIDVSLSVAADGTIVGVNVVYDNGDGYSNPHQERFDGAYQAALIGQNISDAELAVTGGASLTTGAFNKAIADVRAQAS